MSSIPSVCTALQTVLTTVANTAARSTGFIQRQRQLTGAGFVQALVFGFLAKPTMSLDQLAQTAAAVGTPISAQGLDQRFTPQAAACLQAVLGTAVQQCVTADPVAIPLLQRFSGVYVLDSTTIMLPDAHRDVWQGNGGSTGVGTSAALKVQVLWNLSTGSLQHIGLQDGRANDSVAPAQAVHLPLGALRIADLGYFALDRLTTLAAQRVYMLSRLPPQVAIFDHQGQRCDLLALLRHADAPLDMDVTIGARHRLAVRLLAVPVPRAVADQRRRRLREAWRDKGRTPSTRILALAAWTVVITTVPTTMLTLPEALVLLRARWQIELLFKLWKSHGQVATWRTQQPWRILCEVYAKLLAMVVLHWVLLVTCWHHPNRSLRKAAQTVQHHALTLAHALVTSRTRLVTALHLLQQCFSVGGRINARRKQPNTYQLLLALADDSLS